MGGDVRPLVVDFEDGVSAPQTGSLFTRNLPGGRYFVTLGNSESLSGIEDKWMTLKMYAIVNECW